MDIKDFILIGGGILIIMVVGHGFWLAWCAKREPLRLDIVPDLIPDDIDEMERLRGELPNGGARIVNRREPRREPENMLLDLPPPAAEEPQDMVPSVTEPVVGSAAAEAPGNPVARAQNKPKVRQAPPRKPRLDDDLLSTSPVSASVPGLEPLAEPISAGTDSDGVSAHVVREVTLTSEARVPAVTGNRRKRGVEAAAREAKPRVRESAAPQSPQEASAVEELLIVNVLAGRGQRFAGEGLVNALRSQGLRYGEMNIFHCVEPATKAKLYSVANAIEPGTFDLSDLNALQTPGMTFFLQLPGPDDPLGVFNDMLQAARSVATQLGGDVRDEELSVLTGQATEHMRQRIADFARRRLSKRA